MNINSNLSSYMHIYFHMISKVITQIIENGYFACKEQEASQKVFFLNSMSSVDTLFPNANLMKKFCLPSTNCSPKFTCMNMQYIDFYSADFLLLYTTGF